MKIKEFIARFSQAHNIFLLISIPVIISFILISPPGWGLDEQVHIARVWQESKLILYPQKMPGGFYGGEIPKPLADLLDQGHKDSNSVNRARYFFEREDFKNRATYSSLESIKITKSTPTVIYDFGATGIYNPISYLPATIGMSVASLFGMTVGGHIMLAKFMSAAFYIVTIFFALRFIRQDKIKWLIMIVALLPTSLYQASIITADTFSIAVTLLFLSIVLGVLVDREKIKKRTAWYLAISSILMVFTKINYVLFLGLLLLIPLSSLKVNIKQARIIKIASITGLAALAGILTLLSLRYVSATGYGGNDVSSVGQLNWVVSHPFDAILVLFRTAVIHGQVWINSIIGLFGFNAVTIPNIMASLYFIVIFVAALYTNPISKKLAWIIFMTGAIVNLSIIGALYLSYNSVGNIAVNGVQGRYFIPCLPLLAYGLAKILPIDLRISKDKINAPIIFGVSAFVMSFTGLLIYAMAMFSF